MLYALLAIAVLVLLVTWLKLNPFIALLISSLTLGAMVVATQGTLTMTEVLKAFQTGFGNTLAGTGAIIVLGVVFGKLLAESGGAGVLAKQFIQTLGPDRIGLCIILLALCVGMTTWFAVGLLLILPIVITLAKETGKPFLLMVLPLLSFLSVMHGLMPPHPGPVIAIEALHADMGKVILWALVLGIPVAAIAGPIFAKIAVKRVEVATPEFTPSVSANQTLPTFGLTIFTVLLPVMLLLAGTLVELLHAKEALWGKVCLFIGHPVIALLLSVLFAMWAFGKRCGRSAGELLKFSEQSVSGIGMTLILVGAGGGFALVMRTAGVDKQLADLATREAKLQREFEGGSAERAGLAEKVDAPTLARYQHLLDRKGDNVVVGVKGGICGGCHMKLPTQTVVTAKAQADIVTCINCSRILFWTRDMDH